MTRLLSLLFLVIGLSCGDRPVESQTISKDDQIKSTTNIRKVRLGESNYFIELPDDFNLSEARGKEGQLGYNIIPKDTSSTMFGFINIKAGNPIGDASGYDNKGKVFTTSYLSNKKVEWKIYQTETGYYDAFTNESGDLNATASSKKRNEIDSLVSIIATLKQE